MNLKDQDGATPLVLAAKRGFDEIAQEFIGVW